VPKNKVTNRSIHLYTPDNPLRSGTIDPNYEWYTKPVENGNDLFGVITSIGVTPYNGPL
jgi:hypothetical protein